MANKEEHPTSVSPIRVLRLSNTDTLTGYGLVVGRWRFVTHRTLGYQGRGRSLSVWRHSKDFTETRR